MAPGWHLEPKATEAGGLLALTQAKGGNMLVQGASALGWPVVASASFT